MSDAIQAQLAQFNNIPAELKAIQQWIVWRSEDIGAAKPTKIPYQWNGYKASVIDPRHWCSFDDAVSAYKSGNFSGIGFVFTNNDPYCFIDFDHTSDPILLERQRNAFQLLNSYSELSPSGHGLHIICRASVPGGRKRSSIEIYSDGRYATFTGNVYHNVAIASRQNEVMSLWEQLGTGQHQQFIYKGDVEEKQSDADIIRIASEAENGEKFERLYKGDWGGLYPSQSEADISLINIIAFYTKNRPQIARIFRASALGQRDKAKRNDYLNWMLDKAFDKELPPIDMEGLKIEAEDAIRESSLTVKPSPHKTFDVGSTPTSPTNNDVKNENNRQRNFTTFNQDQGHSQTTLQNQSESSQQEALRKEQTLLFSKKQRQNSNSEGMVSGIQNHSQMSTLPGKSSGMSGLSSFRPNGERNFSEPNSEYGMEQSQDFKRNSEMYSSVRELSSEASLEGKEYLNNSLYGVNHNASAASFNGRTAPFDGVNEGSNPSAASKKIIPTKEKLYLYPPPGLVGEIANFIYQAAPRPVAEIAVAAAIGLMAGICGRAYNVSSTGLNQYVLLLAKTGRGKEAIQSGISKLIYAVRQQVPTIEECIGPDEIASGPALYKYLHNKPCFVSVLSEFGLRLQQLSDTNAGGSNVSLRRMILQLYAKSGFNDIAHPSIYSDKDKNINAIASPAFSILGESTPHTFYRNLHEEMISEGLLPRFLLIEYDGDRVPENSNHAQVKPDPELIDKLASCAANAAQVQNAQPRRVITVGFSEAANELSKKYSMRCDNFINNKNNNEVVIELWNRAHLKVLKLAAIVAVGVNMWNPIIEKEHMEWAIGMVNADIETLSAKFEEGKIGANTQEVKQVDEIIKVIKEYLKSTWEGIAKNCTPKDEKLHQDKVIPYAYISKKTISNACFRTDKMGSTFALKRALQIMLDRDYINELSREQMKTKFGTTQKAYMVTNAKILME